MGKVQEAQAEFERALAGNPDDPALLGGLAWLKAQNGNLDDARKAALRSVEIDPQSIDGHFAMAKIHELSGEADLAELSRARVRELAPDNARYLSEL